MASGVEELLDMLFEMVDEAKNMPLSSDKCVLERDRALDLIDDIRAQFPVELGEAKKLVASRNDYIAAAKREAEVIRKQAEAEAQRMLAEESVLNQAKQRSAELMRQAEERSRELKRSANEYCEDALRRTEEAVAEAYDEIKKSRARFRAAASATAAGSPSGGRAAYDAAASAGGGRGAMAGAAPPAANQLPGGAVREGPPPLCATVGGPPGKMKGGWGRPSFFTKNFLDIWRREVYNNNNQPAGGAGRSGSMEKKASEWTKRGKLSCLLRDTAAKETGGGERGEHR